MIFFSLKKKWRKLKRSRQIIFVFFKYGVEHLIDRTKIGFSLKLKRKKISHPQASTAERFKLALEELGPTFIKFGQILSVRPDLLPPAYIKELEKLQDQALSLDVFSPKKIIEKELGDKQENLFLKFEETPLSTASLSQVHKAVLLNGEKVAIKVQRPNIKELINLDLDILENLIGVIKSRFHNNWNYHPKLMIDEFRRTISKELDFTFEGYNFEKFSKNFKDIDHIQTPKIYWKHSSKRVLTMELMKGKKIDQIKNQQTYNHKAIAENLANMFLKQILEDGFFHADPHPANILVNPPDKIIILDVGMVGHIDDYTATNGARLIHSIIDKNINESIRCLKNLGVVLDDINQAKLRQDLSELFERYIDIPLKHIEIRQANQDVLEVMVKHNLTFPPNLILMIKVLATIEANAKYLDPDFNMIIVAKPFVKKLLRQKMSAKELYKKGKSFLREGMELFEELPQNTMDILHKIQDGSLTINFEHKGLNNLTTEIDHLSNKTSFSLIIASLIVGSALVLQQEIPPIIYGYSAIGIIGYLLAAILGLGLVTSIVKTSLKSRKNTKKQ